MSTPRIIFEDNQILVCLKPPGYLSQPSSHKAPDMLSSLKQDLKERYSKPGNVFLGLVHRLDLNVGGVMIFAKTSKAASRLSESIRKGEFKKTYLAVIEGKIEPGSGGEFIDHLQKDINLMKAIPVDEISGKRASLSFRSLSTKAMNGYQTTLVEIDLETGRFHQIRSQFASRNHPVTNDIKYGARKLIDADIIALWAFKLTVPHPVTKEWLTFRVAPENELFINYDDIIDKLTKEVNTDD